jgi:hypothetical protein
MRAGPKRSHLWIMKPCTVTTRRYIRRNDGLPAEPTHTLVLTSPVGHFVDIRALAHSTSPSPSSSSTGPLPLPGVSRALVEPIANAQQSLDWAFAGRAWTADRPGDDGAQNCGWTHVVDSKSGEEGEVDEGIMRMRKDLGVDGKEYEWVCEVQCSAVRRCASRVMSSCGVGKDCARVCVQPKMLISRLQEVETGSSENADGSVQTYEEGWLGVPTYLDSTTPYVPSDADDAIIHFKSLTTEPPRERTCVILCTPGFYDGGALPAGMIIKVGDWCQGVLRTSATSEGFFASRWMRRCGEWEMLLDIGTDADADLKDGTEQSSKGGSMEAIIQWLAKHTGHMGARRPIPEWHGAKFELKAVYDE